MRGRLFIALAVGLAIAWPSAASAQTNLQLEALKRLKNLDLESNPALKKIVLQHLETSKGKPAFVEIVRDFKLNGHEAELIRFAQAHAKKSIGVEAIRLALTEPGLKLVADAVNGTDPNAALATTEALANAQSPKTEPILLHAVVDNTKPLALRIVAVNGLAKAKTGAGARLAEAQAGRIPADLNFAAGNAMRSVRWKNLRAQAAKQFPPPTGLGQALPPLAKLITMKGDIANGEKVFFRPQSTCATCHQVNGRGIDFGPKLSGIGTKLGKEALYLSVLDPNAGIPFGYEAWLLKTINSGEALGIITSQTDDEVTLKLPGGIAITHKTADIVSRVQLPTSIMPPGLQATMTPQDLVDMIAYLHSLKQAKP
ncbi:MAG: c-type cytochrome [Verrucomicrobiota bacterium]|nr:c-type cytochrome [Verrucomicrobiota bacterium]